MILPSDAGGHAVLTVNLQIEFVREYEQMLKLFVQ
jgi:hypothetical protein